MAIPSLRSNGRAGIADAIPASLSVAQKIPAARLTAARPDDLDCPSTDTVFRVDRKAKHWHHEHERSTGAKDKERQVGGRSWWS